LRKKTLLEEALASAKKALEPPPPQSERRGKSRALVDEYVETQSQHQPQSQELSPVAETSLITETGHVRETSPVKFADEGLSETGHARETRHVSPTVLDENLATYAEAQSYSKGHLRLNHDFFDKVVTQLEPHEQLLFIHLLRYRKGTTDTTVILSFPALARRTRLSQSSLNRAAKSLEAKGLIQRESYTFGRNHQQGTTFRLVTPTSLVTGTGHSRETSPVTETRIIETHLKEHTNTAGVGVSSRFALQECRKYAESLRGEGIANPGGYATKIHRSGEADEMIEKFLNPTVQPKPVDASACPDCSGSGWWYPQGTNKGAARCKHERLLTLST
jgi:DNA-binding Lrp family transcriptional regulator